MIGRGDRTAPCLSSRCAAIEVYAIDGAPGRDRKVLDFRVDPRFVGSRWYRLRGGVGLSPEPLSRAGRRRRNMTDQLTLEPQDEALRLSRRLDSLHDLLYTRGGIRPANAAVEELSKLLFLRIAAARRPEIETPGYGAIGEAMETASSGSGEAIAAAKAAFTSAVSSSHLAARLPDGGRQSVWPVDEPLRVSRPDVLAEAIDMLASIDHGRSAGYDPIGAAFDVFLRGRYENAGGLGTYLTPASVVDAMVAIGLFLVEAETAPGDPVGLMGDPCCGSGRFLVALAHRLRRAPIAASDEDLSGLLIGADQSTSAVATTRVNLMAAGLDAHEVLAVQDSITDEWVARLDSRFSLILTNPPFGDGKYDDREGIAHTSTVFPALAGAGRIDPSLAFVAKCVKLLAPGGVAGIILPDGVLDGPAMRDLVLGPGSIRSGIRLEGVVSLPPATFAPAGTTAKTSVIFLRRAQPAPERCVFLARADHVGYLMRRGSVATDPSGDDLPGVVDAIRRTAISAAPTGNLFRPALSDLVSLDASSISAEATSARRNLLDTGGRALRGILEHKERRRAPVADGLPFVSVLHVDELGGIDWEEADGYRPSTPGQLAESGDVIVSLLNPAKFRAAVIPDDKPCVQCSAEFGVFRSMIDPYAALALLQHESVRAQAAPLGRGTSSSRRRVQPDDILDLVIPSFTSAWVASAGEATREALHRIAQSREELSAIYASRASA